MKRFLLFLVAVVALASCGNDDEIMDVDFVPVEFKFDVTNAAGESLIDKESPAYDSDFVANTYIKFQGKVYKMNEDAEESAKPSTRAYFARFHGIMIEQQTAYGTNETKVLAKIGPFLSDYDWKSEEIEIHWGDSSEDKIVFTSVVTKWNKDGAAEFSRKHLFNGADCTETFQKPYGYMQLVKNSTKGN
jgi:hypothetical protein